MTRPGSSRRNSDEFIEEFSRMLINRDKVFRAQLDLSTEQQYLQQQEELKQALERHEEIRENACHTLDIHKQLQAHLREEEARQAREQEQETLRQLQRQTAQRKADDEAKKAKEEEEIRKKLAEAEALAKRNAAAEAERRQRASNPAPTPPAQSQMPPAQTQVQMQAQRPPTQSQQPRPQPQPQLAIKPQPQPQKQQVQSQASPTAPLVSQSSTLTTSVAERDALHQRYLSLHKKLKGLRNSMSNAGPDVKKWTGEKFIFRKMLGQLSNDNAPGLNPAEKQELARSNQKKRNDMLAMLRQVKNGPGPTVDAREYILNPSADLSRMDPRAAQVPVLFIFMFSVCAKAGIRQLRNNAGHVMADLVGISLAFLFGHNELRWNGESFIDILLAKYHKTCPILFGIYGPEATVAGKLRLAWPSDIIVDTNDKVVGHEFVGDQAFYEDMQGLAMGWAALTLRDFRRSRAATNACPQWHFWQTLARIVNTPPNEVTRTHFIVLKNMLENYADKFIKFYGQAATVALRKAVIEFPATQPKGSAAVDGVKILKDVFQQKWKIVL